MTHLSELQLSMYADGALESDEATSHLDSCVNCQALATKYVSEKRSIGAVLQEHDVAETPDFEVPQFSRPASFSRFAIANIIMGLIVWIAQFLWKSVFEGLIFETLSWFSIPIPDVYGLMVSITKILSEEGTTMIDHYFFIVIAGLSIPVLTLLLFSYRRSRSTIVSAGLILIAAGIIVPTPVNALEIRRGESMVTIAADEVVNDTLIISASTIVVEGKVNGDLIAFGSRIIVSGSITGNLITFGESITINASVGGSAFGAAETYTIENAEIKGDLWSAGETISIGKETEVSRNTTSAGETVSISGRVAKDLRVFAEKLEVEGSVGRNLDVFAEQLKLLGDSHIAGDVNFHSDSEENLTRSGASRVDGNIEFLRMGDGHKHQNRYFTISFYVRQLLWMVSAFMTGLALLWLVPGLRDLTMVDGLEGLKTAGIGLVTIISLPIISVLIGFTVIGLPFTVIGFFSWISLLFIAKIVLASVIGRLVLERQERGSSLPLTLLAGLGIITVAINIPAIGGVLNFLLTILGAGMIVWLVLDYADELRN